MSSDGRKLTSQRKLHLILEQHGGLYGSIDLLHLKSHLQSYFACSCHYTESL